MASFCVDFNYATCVNKSCTRNVCAICYLPTHAAKNHTKPKSMSSNITPREILWSLGGWNNPTIMIEGTTNALQHGIRAPSTSRWKWKKHSLYMSTKISKNTVDWLAVFLYNVLHTIFKKGGAQIIFLFFNCNQTNPLALANHFFKGKSHKGLEGKLGVDFSYSFPPLKKKLIF